MIYLMGCYGNVLDFYGICLVGGWKTARKNMRNRHLYSWENQHISWKLEISCHSFPLDTSMHTICIFVIEFFSILNCLSDGRQVFCINFVQPSPSPSMVLVYFITSQTWWFSSGKSLGFISNSTIFRRWGVMNPWEMPDPLVMTVTYGK